MAAAHWAGMFAIDYLTADWDDEEETEFQMSAAGYADPLRGATWVPFDQHPERSKHRSRPASAGDYVAYGESR